MICMVLAAGYATRLYPLTENFPKPLLKVKEKTILDWLLDDIDSAKEISKYVIISNHKFVEHFENWAKDKELSAPIVVLDDGSTDNDNRLGAVKDIEFAIEKENIDEDILIIAGDNVLDFSFGGFINYFKEKNATCVMRYFEEREEKLKKTGVVVVDDNGYIKSMVEKPPVPPSNWAVPPFYIYKRDDVQLVKKGIESGCGTDAPGSFIAWLCTQCDVYAMEMPGKRYDIGNLESYKAVEETYNGITIK